MADELVEGSDGAPLRLVIVDDVEPLREFLRRVTDVDARFAVVGEAADGAAAIQMTCETQPDVVLLDVRMPGLDGIAALRAIKQARPGTRVVMFSADSTRRHEALRSGADAWVDKTDSYRDLLDALADHHP